MRRIFVERGAEFFEKGKSRSSGKTGALTQDMDIDRGLDDLGEEKTSTATMTTEDLLKMRMEIMPHL